MSPISLLDLTDDLLNEIAVHLPPSSRLNLACTSHRLYTAVWSTHAEDDIIHRFPLERKVTFDLRVLLKATTTNNQQHHETLRTVPARSRQQHVNVAVNRIGTLVAVLPYDNVLRFICPRRASVIASFPVPGFFANDVWDVTKGMRRPHPRPPTIVYADDAGLDVESTLDFSGDGRLLILACRTWVRLFNVQQHSIHSTSSSSSSSSSSSFKTTPTITPSGQITLNEALQFLSDHLRATGNNSGQHNNSFQDVTGGAAHLSADGRRIAWVIFLGNPATVHVTVWRREIQHEKQKWVGEFCIVADRVWTRRWSAIAWARPIFTPNGKDLVVVVNCAHKETRVVNIGGAYHRTKLCRFQLTRVDVDIAARTNGRKGVMKRTTEWMNLAPDVYPRLLAEAIARVLRGRIIHEMGSEFALNEKMSSKCSGSAKSNGENEDDMLYNTNNNHGHINGVEEFNSLSSSPPPPPPQGNEFHHLINHEDHDIVNNEPHDENIVQSEEDDGGLQSPASAFQNNNNNNHHNRNALSLPLSLMNEIVRAKPHGDHHNKKTWGREAMNTSQGIRMLRSCGLTLNSMHSCPTEATYKTLSFGETSHPWYMSKAPMTSFHFSVSGKRVLLAPSTHSNIMRTMMLNGDRHSHDVNYVEDKRQTMHRRQRRNTVFKKMPWRAAFAYVTAFSASGQWLAGASLLADDQCCVCVRNVTLAEYFGELKTE